MGRNKQQRLKENREIQRECNIQTIREYEKKMETLEEQVGKLSLSIAALNKANRIATYSLSYLEHVPEEAKLYSSIGKMFVHEQRDKIFSSLADSIEHTNDRIPKLRETLQKFDQRRTEQSKALQELYESIQVSST